MCYKGDRSNKPIYHMSLFKNICKLTCLVLIFVSHAKGSENKTCNVLLNNYLVYDIFETDPEVLESINATPSFDLVYTGRYAGPTDKVYYLFEASYLKFEPEFETERLKVSYYDQKDKTNDQELLGEFSKPENIEFFGTDFVNSNGYFEPSLTLTELQFGTSIAASLVRNTLLIRDKKTLEILGILSWSFETNKKLYHVGYLIFKKYRRQGFAKEALLGAVEKIRLKDPSARIGLYILENNRASQKLAEAAGFKKDILKSITLSEGYRYYLP